MQWDDTRRAQDRLSHPAHAEQQEQDPNRELQEMKRDTIEERAERCYDEDQQHKAGECAKSRRAPAANSGNGEHDG